MRLQVGCLCEWLSWWKPLTINVDRYSTVLLKCCVNRTFVKYTRCYVWRKQLWTPTLKPHPISQAWWEYCTMVWSSCQALRHGWLRNGQECQVRTSCVYYENSKSGFINSQVKVLSLIQVKRFMRSKSRTFKKGIPKYRNGLNENSLHK